MDRFELGIILKFFFMYGDRELEAKIREYETKLRDEESNYFQPVRSHKTYGELKAIRNDIRDTKQELQVLYNMRDKKM